MTVKVNTADLRMAATEPMHVPFLIRNAEKLARMTEGAQMGSVHVGSAALALYATASYMHESVIRNHEAIAAGLQVAADSYDATDEDNREQVDKVYRLTEADLREKEGER